MGVALCLSPLAFYGQAEIQRYVIASGGRIAVEDTNGYEFPFTVGETSVKSHSDYGDDGEFDFTEGFQQGDIVLIPGLEIYTSSTISQCPQYYDGSIIVNYDGCIGPFNITLIGNGDTIVVEDLPESYMYVFKDLDSGSYQVTVRGSNFCAQRDTQRVDIKNYSCDVKVYTGITPNGDGKNDKWIIDNLEINPNNKVTIYNRWGAKVWSTTDYDNDDRVWSGIGSNGKELPTGTYFYIIEVEGNSPASGSGWIQLNR